MNSLNDVKNLYSEKLYTDFSDNNSLGELVNRIKNSKDIINIPIWCSQSEPAILVKYLYRTNQKNLLNKIRFFVNWTAEGIAGDEKSCDVLTEKTDLISKDNEKEYELKVIMLNETEPYSYKIGGTIVVVNMSDKKIDVSALQIRYYFTDDGNDNSSVSCNNCGCILKESPYYINYTDKVNASIRKPIISYKEVDSYAVFSFKEKCLLSAGSRIVTDFSITNISCKKYNQLNDYSYKNSTGIVVMHDNKIISGNSPSLI